MSRWPIASVLTSTPIYSNPMLFFPHSNQFRPRYTQSIEANQSTNLHGLGRWEETRPSGTLQGAYSMLTPHRQHQRSGLNLGFMEL